MNSKYYEELRSYGQSAYSWADDKDDILNYVVYEQIREAIENINNKSNVDIIKKLQELENELRNKIKTYLFMYSRKEVMVVLLEHKALFRSQMSIENVEGGDYGIVTRHAEILWLISILLEGKQREFRNRSLLKGSKNLAMAFRFGYYFNVLKENIEWYTYSKDIQKIGEPELEKFFVHGHFYTPEYNKYMDDLLRVARETPGEIRIRDARLEKMLQDKGLDIKEIESQVSGILRDTIGSSLQDIIDFCHFPLRQEQVEFYIISKVDEYYQRLAKEITCDSEGYRNIIKMFSLNELDEEKIKDIKNIELKSIYEIDGEIIFYPFDMTCNITCLTQFLIRKHFEDRYIHVFEENIQKSIKHRLRGIEENISTYLCYALTEELALSGYVVPLEKGLPKAEVNSITVKINKNTVNLLKNKTCDLGDIDILAGDEEKGHILNIEFKYFEPVVELHKINDRYKISDRIKYIKKAKQRGDVLQENITHILNFLNIEQEKEYIVRTIFVSPRSDYWLLNKVSVECKEEKYALEWEECKELVEYIGWEEFIERLGTKSI